MNAKVIARRAAPFDPMTHAIFAEAMRVMYWAYDWGEQRLGEGLVTADHDFDGWNSELAKFNGPPPRVGDVIQLSGSGRSIVVKRALFDRGWKVEIGLAE